MAAYCNGCLSTDVNEAAIATTSKYGTTIPQPSEIASFAPPEPSKATIGSAQAMASWITHGNGSSRDVSTNASAARKYGSGSVTSSNCEMVERRSRREISSSMRVAKQEAWFSAPSQTKWTARLG